VIIQPIVVLGKAAAVSWLIPVTNCLRTDMEAAACAVGRWHGGAWREGNTRLLVNGLLPLPQRGFVSAQ